MNKELPGIIYKINERAYYEKFTQNLLKHFQNNLDSIYGKIKQGEIKQIKKSFSHRLYFDSNRRVSRITISSDLKGLFVDLGVGKGLKLDEIGYQRIGRSLIGRKVKNRRAGRWYLKTVYGQTIRLMNIVSQQRGDEYTIIVKQALDSIPDINIKI